MKAQQATKTPPKNPPWCATEDQPLMLMVCASPSETYLFDYVGFWVKRADQEIALNFGVASVEITIQDPDLPIFDLLENLAKKQITKIEADGRITIRVVEPEKEEGDTNDPDSNTL